MSYSPFSRAAARYRDVDIDSKVMNATPHGLITLLYEELIREFNVYKSALEQGDREKRYQAQAKIFRLIGNLESSLDFEKGGEVARSLFRSYAYIRHNFGQTIKTLDPVPLKDAQKAVADLLSAWTEIGQ
ncbi:flagellar biosynthesis protein FliS [Zymomonas mobilis subsp. mobilis ZM4 = ATCC 31821]|uniref:Flagellar secretion chaperone FliS n=2 Tax=Zymomonas mobilis subsp. mobilis TaxID=120045 RepID=Q5NPT4_ZYMMO|nr:flagellar export chaperone FliS [Zymomonas mobilis]AAV89276.1 flagellar protein FliS [Zymomonas mobilis subsp. mobilis ZM4 = ATCC 31821]ACV75162.1 flagellar protein FliS [Zymomonas mobilis subsp. mobilis NCIMB 11163]AEH62998.1 flagellar protein FliS [Zymomonas mobilis subsp. mobilis ATCC 10988]AFN56524.1 flagellar protein FliS [Zymomonas mobilis subsp. mobilis ATCC 29191]AHB09950.1 flagellin-specific chaperone FliS [Zymomonas mobilis subsp. mobilis str. CP4 = NRRL B-14023]